MPDHDGYGDRPWRTGRKVGRTIYDAHDRLIGVMDTAALAGLVTLGVNALDAPCHPFDGPCVGPDRCRNHGGIPRARAGASALRCVARRGFLVRCTRTAGHDGMHEGRTLSGLICWPHAKAEAVRDV